MLALQLQHLILCMDFSTLHYKLVLIYKTLHQQYQSSHTFRKIQQNWVIIHEGLY